MSSNEVVTEFSLVSEFSPTLWNAAVDHATVSDAGRITFTFRNQMGDYHRDISKGKPAYFGAIPRRAGFF